MGSSPISTDTTKDYRTERRMWIKEKAYPGRLGRCPGLCSGRSEVDHRAHNPGVGGSNPSPAIQQEKESAMDNESVVTFYISVSGKDYRKYDQHFVSIVTRDKSVIEAFGEDIKNLIAKYTEKTCQVITIGGNK